MMKHLLTLVLFCFSLAHAGSEPTWQRDSRNLLTNFNNMYQPCVVETGGEYPYKMWFFGWAAATTNPGWPGCDAIFLARAKDLISWEVYSGKDTWDTTMSPQQWVPVLHASDRWYDAWHVGDPSVVLKNGVYYMAYSATSKHFGERAGYPATMVQCVMGAVSEDGISWKKTAQPLLIRADDTADPKPDPDRIGDFHRPCLLWDAGKWRLWFDYWLPGKGVCMGYAQNIGEFEAAGGFKIQNDLRQPLIEGWPNPDIIRIGDTYHSFSDAPGYPGASGWKCRQLREAISKDGIHWQLLDFIAPDEDADANHVPQAFATTMDGKRWLYLFYATQIGNRRNDGKYHFEYDRIRAMRRPIDNSEPEKTITPPPHYGQIQKASFENLRGGFAQPDMIYAPFAFWFWDEPLDAAKYPTKAGDMARKMMEQRMNPGYVHPRLSGADIFPGVMKPSQSLPKDQWLSKEWFDSFDVALQSAEAGKGYLGYNDEYMWPVGRAAGRVLKQHPELEKTWLQWKVSDIEGGKSVDLPPSFFTVAAKLASVPNVPNVPNAMQGQWIWKTDAADTARRFFLRRAFDLNAGLPVHKAVLRIAVDNTYQLFINGTAVGAGDDWSKVGTYDVAPLLRPGRNVIAVDGGGDGGLDALLCDLQIDLEDGQQVSVRSDGDWVISKNADADWNQPEFKDTEWSKVRVLGPADMQPWNLPETKPVYQKATVHSATLQRIGSGEAFTWTAPSEGNWRVYTFTQVPGADVNVLDKRLAKAFIEIAHQPYADRLGARMGKSIPGVFCDTEGSYGNNGNGIPWSDDLAAHYQAETGRDVQLWMPMMFDDDAEGISARARVDWFNAMSDLYSGFHGEINDWVEQHGMYYIANLWEESLQWQTTMLGDYMKNMRGFSMPGTDCLALKAYDARDFKETQAVAEFEGRRLMSEIMGAGNWGTFNPITIKECTNSVVAWGVGHVVAHGIFMTRDLDHNPWTPDWFDVNPLWSNLHLWTDFTRRASYVNSHGRAMPDVLLLQPGESAWALLGQTDKLWGSSIHNLGVLDGLYSPEVQTINKLYSDAMRQMTRHRVEYLIADAHYIGQMKREGSQLVRGDFRFKTIVMPPMAVMQMAQAKAVVDFAKAGGHVYMLGKLPTGSTENGLHDLAMAALMKELQAQPTAKACAQGLEAELKANAPGLESHIQFLSGEFPMLQHHRRIDGRDFFWLVNNSKEARQSVVQVTGASGEASVWDCETGKVRRVASTNDGGHSKLQLAFQPHEAYWLVFDSEKPPLAGPVVELTDRKALLQFTSTGWKVRVEPTAQPNLQHAVVIPPALTAAEGVERDLSLWETWIDLPRYFSGLIDYTQTIKLPDFEGDLVLDLGMVNHIAEVWVNGKPLGAKLWPPHRFPCDAFRPGKNQVRIRVGNLINNNYNMASPSGLLGPVTVQ